MSDRNYYCLCDDNCKFPTMTTEQILATIAAVTGTTVTNVEDAFITKLKEGNTNGNISFWIGTTVQYNAIVAAGEIVDNCLYILTDETFGEDVNIAINDIQRNISTFEIAMSETNKNLQELTERIDAQIVDLRNELHQDIQSLENNVNSNIASLQRAVVELNQDVRSIEGSIDAKVESLRTELMQRTEAIEGNIVALDRRIQALEAK